MVMKKVTARRSPRRVGVADADAALIASQLEGRGRRRGSPFELRDLFILATAGAAGLTVATHNVEHFGVSEARLGATGRRQRRRRRAVRIERGLRIFAEHGRIPGHGPLVSAGAFVPGRLTGITLLRRATNGY